MTAQISKQQRRQAASHLVASAQCVGNARAALPALVKVTNELDSRKAGWFESHPVGRGS